MFRGSGAVDINLHLPRVCYVVRVAILRNRCDPGSPFGFGRILGGPVWKERIHGSSPDRLREQGYGGAEIR